MSERWGLSSPIFTCFRFMIENNNRSSRNSNNISSSSSSSNRRRRRSNNNSSVSSSNSSSSNTSRESMTSGMRWRIVSSFAGLRELSRK